MTYLLCNQTIETGELMKNRLTNRLTLSAVALGGALLLTDGVLAMNGPDQAQNKTTTPPLNVKVDETAINRTAPLDDSFAPIVQKVAPSVVQISVTSSAPERMLSAPDFDFFRRFFGNGAFGPIMPGQPGSMLDHGLGSGVIVSSDGYILTNNHVVNGAKEIQVTLNDGRTFSARVIGTDPKTDIALIRINAYNLPALPLADSDKVEVGDVVLAVGNPFGIGQTVTRGIISATDRATSSDMDEDFIQTDAAINPGNSGGALVDVDGRLIGINTEILSRSGGNQGIGFAVPSNLCHWVMDGLVKYGHINRGFLGVEIQTLTPSLAQAFKATDQRGVLVSAVTPGSAAAAAGLQSGDIILDFSGKPVQDASQLKLRVAETAPGVTVPVVVLRNGENKTISVTLKEEPNNQVADANSPNNQNGARQDALHGVAVSNLTQEARSQLNIPANVQGALITNVDPVSPSYEAGLRTGNVILEINHQPVKDAQDAVKDTEKPIGNETLVKVWSGLGTHYLTVPSSNIG
jgi:serine protease Do